MRQYTIQDTHQSQLHLARLAMTRRIPTNCLPESMLADPRPEIAKVPTNADALPTTAPPAPLEDATPQELPKPPSQAHNLAKTQISQKNTVDTKVIKEPP